MNDLVPGFSSLPLGARIAVAAMPYLGWRYSRDAPAVAYASGAVPDLFVKRGESSKVTNCSTLTASILGAVYPDAAWDIEAYGDIQVRSSGLDWERATHGVVVGDSPIRAVERLGIGRRVGELSPGDWHLVQGWRGAIPNDGGHAFLAYAIPGEAAPDISGLMVLEASSRGGIGPKFAPLTVGRLLSRYPILHLARLL